MEFKEAKQKKERGYTVKEAIQEITDNQSDYHDVIVIGVTKDGDIDTAYSVDNTATAIGYLEVVKQDFLDEIRFEE